MTYRDPRDAALDAWNAEKAAGPQVKKRWWKSGGSEKAAGSDNGVIPEQWLDADIRRGISAEEAETRRKKVGWNEISTESTNLFVQFLSYFQGPILYGKTPHSISGTSS